MILFPLPAEAAPLLMALVSAFTAATSQRFPFLLVALRNIIFTALTPAA